MSHNIKLKDKRGNDVTYDDVSEINLLDTSDNEVVFSEKKTEQTKTVTPTTSEQVVMPDENHELTQVTVGAIPEEYIVPAGTLDITENGTHDVTEYANVNVNVSGSSSGEPLEQHLIQVVDFDGTVLDSQYLNTGDTYTLPAAPIGRPRLSFQEWSSPVEIVDNAITVGDSDITIGAVYTTASGLSEFDITLTKKTGLSVTLNMDGTKDWGDGTSDTETSHTYSSYGDYTITCNGTNMTTSSTSGLFGQSSTSMKDYSLTAVRIANVESITSYAFHSCYSLKTATISTVNGTSIISVGSYTFGSCLGLKAIIFPSKLRLLGEGAVHNCRSLMFVVINRNSIQAIEKKTFTFCYSLKTITFPNDTKFTVIGDSAFQYCASLKTITIPNNVVLIDRMAFQYCASLKTITIPENTASGSFAFANCPSLTSAILLGGQITLSGIFNGCTSLNKIVLPNSVTKLDTDFVNNCSALSSITIPANITAIGLRAFQKCCSLVSLTIPETVGNIGNYAFDGCICLTEINIPSGVTSIPTYMLQNCTSLRKIKIDGATKIGNYAFNYCSSIILYDFTQATAVPTLANTNAFTSINQLCKIVVPDSLYDEWIAATNWSTYADYIYKQSEVNLETE